MTKEVIKKLIEDSKNQLEQDHDNFVKSIKDDLSSFKKKTLERI